MLNDMKTALTELFLLSRDAIHIHIGLGIYVLAMLLLRRGPARANRHSGFPDVGKRHS